eukprot:GILK01001663.1.p1 GENE.GILK01001663.1~~GILK01001663.1.p1  ORF type:complete len:926 (+),score=232.32 GILK01001663.1:60-2780(+)
MDAEASDLHAENRRFFIDFLTQDHGHGEYAEKLREMMKKNERRLVVNLDDLRSFNAEKAADLLHKPLESITAFEEAIKSVVNDENPSYLKNKDIEFRVAFEGSFGRNHVSPRGLAAPLVSTLVCVEGIVTKCSIVRPKVVRSVHFCEAKADFIVRNYRDATSLSRDLPTSSVYPTKDEEGNPLTTEFGLCVYKDFQTFTMQEMPEKSPTGQLPRSVDIMLDEDLVDKCKPGDRVQVVGVYKAMPSTSNGTTSGVFRTVIIANNVRSLAKEVHAPVMTPNDIKHIKKLAKKKDVFELLGRSLAPSIFGHEEIKKALLLLLLGGVEKNLDNGTHIRGDINILMVGDPSTAKSQMLRFILNIAPLAINTTGRGSSGVGLTAAVTVDRDSGERRLEAGAMVLADRGVVCIDEFDKMNEIDRVAIHEVMEQQTVTIAKAGIHTSLNARCSVVAAANPVYGQYDKSMAPTKNIGLPDSLLSRFDLLFIVLDTLDSEGDRGVSSHVLRMHRYVKPGDEGEMPIDTDNSVVIEDLPDAKEEEEETPVMEKFNKLLHGTKKGLDLVTIAFLRKFIFYAKHKVKPVMSEEATELIASHYAQLRNKDDAASHKTLPVTARTLETLIRLSTAHAKCRLSETVTEADCKAAMDLMNFALYKDKEAKERRTREPKEKAAGKDGNSSDEDGDSDDEDDTDDKLFRTSVKPTASPAKTPSTRSKGDVAAAEEMTPLTPSRRSKQANKSPRTPSSASKRAAAEEEEQDGEAMETEPTTTKTPSPSKGQKRSRSTPASKRGTPVAATAEEEEEQLEDRRRNKRHQGEKTPSKDTTAAPVEDTEMTVAIEEETPVDPDRLHLFTKSMGRVLATEHETTYVVDALIAAINRLSKSSPFTREEAEPILKELDKQNKVMYSDGTVHII